MINGDSLSDLIVFVLLLLISLLNTFLFHFDLTKTLLDWSMKYSWLISILFVFLMLKYFNNCFYSCMYFKDCPWLFFFTMVILCSWIVHTSISLFSRNVHGCFVCGNPLLTNYFTLVFHKFQGMSMIALHMVNPCSWIVSH